MDVVTALGSLALGSRTRRLSDMLFDQVGEIYARRCIDLDPQFFPLIEALRQHEGVGIVALSEALGVTHAAVSLLVKRARKAGIVSITTPSDDARCRNVYLTARGRDFVRRLEPIWRDLRASVDHLLATNAPTFLEQLAGVETALRTVPLSERIEMRREPPLEILEWDEQYAPAFRDLNEEWIRSFFELEAEDTRLLDSPGESIIAHGGTVLFARLGGAIVGTCAILRLNDTTMELAKMAVTSLARGRGVGRSLLEHAQRWARSHGAETLYLESSTKLVSALRLYRSFGFEECAPIHPTAFRRADVAMRKSLARGKRNL